MSLPLGGHFDLAGDWKVCCKPSGGAKSHVTHRLGFDVDIDTSYTRFDGTRVPMTPAVRDDFRRAVFNRGFGRYLIEKSLHFRLNEDVIDSYMGRLK